MFPPRLGEGGSIVNAQLPIESDTLLCSAKPYDFKEFTVFFPVSFNRNPVRGFRRLQKTYEHPLRIRNPLL